MQLTYQPLARHLDHGVVILHQLAHGVQHVEGGDFPQGGQPPLQRRIHRQKIAVLEGAMGQGPRDGEGGGLQTVVAEIVLERRQGFVLRARVWFRVRV